MQNNDKPGAPRMMMIKCRLDYDHRIPGRRTHVTNNMFLNDHPHTTGKKEIVVL